jgi:hypothetical protein
MEICDDKFVEKMRFLWSGRCLMGFFGDFGEKLGEFRVGDGCRKVGK